MFTTSDLSLNQYHHVFFQVARDTSNVITTYMYDNTLNALGTLDTSFGSHPILNVFQLLDASGSNPLVIGKGSSYQYNLDVAHFAIYNRTLTTTQQATLMNYTNETFLEPHTESTLYMVSAAGGKFYIDSVEAPVLDVSYGIYVFDQRDSTNGTHPLRLSTVSDGTHNGGTEYTRGVVTNGTPGSINAYTLIQIDNLTPPILYYYCSNHGGMGSMLSLVDYTYFVKVVQNAIGDSVYAFSEDGVTYYNQPPLSFVAPYIYQFNLVGSMANYDLAFGTEVDNANTVIDSYYITSMNATQFVLDLRNHNGNALHYFDSSFNNMGYYTYPSVGSIDEGAITVTDPLAGVINANTYTVSGYSSSFADGIYDLSASSYVEITNLFYKVLDVSGTGFDWLTTGNLYDSDGKYTGSTSTMIGNVEYKGEWIQLRLPYHLVLSELTTNNDATDLDSSPKTIHLLGSNDNGSTFDYLSEASLGKTAATATTFSSVYQRYSTFRMIVEDTHGGSNVHLGFWSLEGTAVREYPENSIAHTMTVSGSPEVYYVDNIPQDEIDFSVNVVYLFDQSDTTNANYQVFFSDIADDPPNTGYMEIVGSPGRTGAYTKLQLDGTYPGQWFYYSTTRDYMGYGPMELGPDSFNKVVGDVVTFTVINRTGVVEPYSITGVTSADIGGADLSGIIEYGRKYDLSYSLVTANKTMVFSVGDVSSSLVIGDYKYYEVAVQTNVVGKPVFAFYDTTDAVWYNQPELSFHKQQVYEFDLSNSVTDNSYVLVFGTEVDNSGTVVSSSTFVDRSQSNKVILNLRDYIGESLVYFEDSSAGMGYVEMPIVDVSYAVTVSGSPEVFYLDGSANPSLDFSANTSYVFDQSDSTNAGQQIVFGYTVDDSANILTSADGVTVMGTPGRSGAYTQLDLSSGFVGPLYYYSDGSANMGMDVIPGQTYGVKVQQNVIGQYVYAFDLCGNGTYYNQPDLSFSAPNVYEFDVSDPSNNSYVLSFGTTVDVSDATIESTYVTRTKTPGMADAKVLLDLTNYSGQSLVYFEDTSAGMGYAEHDIDTAVTYSDPNNPYNPNKNSRTFYGTQTSGNSKSGWEDACQLDTTGPYLAWRPEDYSNGTVESGAYMQINLSADTEIAGVITQGRRTMSEWCTSYRFTYSTDNTTFYDIDGRTSWEGNTDNSTWHYNYFASTLTARYVRIYPLTYRGSPAMTAGLFLGQIGDITNDYAVTVSNEVFYIDGSANPPFDFSANNLYVFDQSDPTNAGQQIVFGYTVDDSANILTSADGVTVMGTPGQPGAYTQLDLSSGFVGPLYYYSDSSANMGYDPTIPVDVSYSFTVRTNVIGEPVWAVYDMSNTVWYNQPDLSFNAPYVYEFDVSDPSNNSYVLSFGTTVDVSDATIESTYVTRTNPPGTTDAKVLLDLRDYSGVSLVYFEDTSAGMGYVEEQPKITFVENIIQSDFDPTSVLSVWATNTSNNNFTYTLSGNNTYSFANGTYDISASDINPVYGLKLNQVLTDGGGSYNGYDWHGQSSYDVNGEPPNTYVTTVDGVDYNGSWIQLSLPYKLRLTQVALTGRYETYGDLSVRMPKDVIMAGSNDNGATFEYIVDVSFSRTVGTNNHQTQNATATNGYRIIRMVIKKSHGNGNINLEYWNVTGHAVEDVEIVVIATPTIVTVSNEIFYLDGSAKPQIDFSANNLYVFDQSDFTNDGQQIVFGYTPDNTTNILTSSDGVTVMGTPGQPGAYTQLDLSSGFVGPLYYYSDSSANMGYDPPSPQLLVVGGGGSGGSGYAGGGGGGGMVTATLTSITSSTSYNIVVGEGGSGSDSSQQAGYNGTNSSFDSYTATGGGGGGYFTSSDGSDGAQGGSGGGGSGSADDGTYPSGGSGTSGQGNSGGDGTYEDRSTMLVYRAGGGGGGSGSAGSNASSGYGGDGGDASQWVVDQQYYAAGGGGGTRVEGNPTDEKGGDGGGYYVSGTLVMLGGSGTPLTAGGTDNGTSGVQNTGSGGGAWASTATSGANGIVKLWIPDDYTYDSSHLTNVTGSITVSSSTFTYGSTTGTMVTFINPGSVTWTPIF